MPILADVIWKAVPLVLVLLAGALVAVATARDVLPNPANDPRLLKQPMDDARYDPAEGCKDSIPAGTEEMIAWLDENVRGVFWGTTRCQKLDDGRWSLHSESRAIDWGLDVSNSKEKRAAERLIEALIKSDREGRTNALARRMGVQGLIYNCKAWWMGDEEMGRYSYCFKKNGERKDDLNRTLAHKDHIHIELNWPGARLRTSFWKSPLAR